MIIPLELDTISHRFYKNLFYEYAPPINFYLYID